MAADDSGPGSPPRLIDRRLLACPRCGWLHYAMTWAETQENARQLAYLTRRYGLSPAEQALYAAAYRQCLRCESPAASFRAAREHDLDRAAGHLVTPVLVRPEETRH